MKKTFYAMAAALCMIAGMASCSADSSQSTAASTPAASSAPASSVAAQSETVAEPEAESFSIGETSTLGNWGITVTGFEVTDRIEADYSGYFSPEEGNHYGVVSLSVINNGKESDTFLPSFALSGDVSAGIYFGDGYEFASTMLLAYSKDIHNSALNPLSSKEGVIIFSLPDVVTSSEDPLTLVFVAGSDTVTYAIR